MVMNTCIIDIYMTNGAAKVSVLWGLREFVVTIVSV